MWAAKYGHRRFIVIIGPEKDHAENMLASLATRFSTGRRLLGDFPEVCYPVACLEGARQRANGPSPSNVCPTGSVFGDPRCFECDANTYRVVVAGLQVDWCSGFPDPQGSVCGTGTAQVDGEYSQTLGACSLEHIDGTTTQNLWPIPSNPSRVVAGHAACRLDYNCQPNGEAWYGWR